VTWVDAAELPPDEVVLPAPVVCALVVPLEVDDVPLLCASTPAPPPMPMTAAAAVASIRPRRPLDRERCLLLFM
jgi:hypothetical protein